MRRVLRFLAMLAVPVSGAALSFVPACKLLHGEAADGGSEAAVASASAAAAPVPSASAADAAPEAPAPAPAPGPSGPPAAGNACSRQDAKETKDTTACAPGGFEELTCSGGVWKVSETCRGPGGCKADAAGVHCDPGTPRAGDACLEAAPPRCSNVHTVFACKNGAWESSLCVPPSKCVRDAKNGVAGCK